MLMPISSTLAELLDVVRFQFCVCETFDSDACSKKNWNKKINKNTNKSCCGYFSLSPRTLYCFSANPRNEISAGIFRSPFLLEISNSNHAVPRAIWETFSEFLIFWNMFNELSGKWHNSRISETRKICVILHEAVMQWLVYC